MTDRKVAIVTGATSGIGRATAIKLASMGYAVALAGRTKATLDKVAAEIKSDSLVIPTDVSKPSDLQNLITAVEQKFRRIDVLVNNAGYAPGIPTHQVSESEWQKIIDTNLSSAFHATRLAWPIMAKQQSGLIVNISSMASRDPFPGLGVYAVAKAGLNMLTLSAAREGDAVGIRVIGIAPAGVDTPMFRGLVGEANVNTAEILIPENVANLIAAAIDGPLAHSSGETIFLHRKPA